MIKRKGTDGDGSMTRLPDGRYRVRVSLGKDAQGRRVREYAYGTTRREAQDNANSLREAARTAAAAPSAGAARKTLADAIEAAEAVLEVRVANGRIKPSTADNYRAGFARLAPLAHRPLRDLSGTELSQFLARLPGSGSTRRNTYICLGKAIDAAMQNGWLQRDPMHAVEAPRATAEREVVHAEADEVRRVCSQASEPYATGFFLMYVCGLRSGEVRGLRWQDIDLDAHRVRVLESKTAAGRRAVPLPRIAEKRLRDLRSEPTDFLLPGRTPGTPVDKRAFARQFDRARDAAGVRAEVTPHSFRHGFASRLLAEGTPVVVVAALMGHSSPSVTHDIYSHVLAQADQQAMDAVWGDVEGLFG